MDFNEIYKKIFAAVSKITPLHPEICFREDCQDILVFWKGMIPDKASTCKVEETLKQYGTVVPYHYRKLNFISFLILR